MERSTSDAWVDTSNVSEMEETEIETIENLDRLRSSTYTCAQGLFANRGDVNLVDICGDANSSDRNEACISIELSWRRGCSSRVTEERATVRVSAEDFLDEWVFTEQGLDDME